MRSLRIFCIWLLVSISLYGSNCSSPRTGIQGSYIYSCGCWYFLHAVVLSIPSWLRWNCSNPSYTKFFSLSRLWGIITYGSSKSMHTNTIPCSPKVSINFSLFCSPKLIPYFYPTCSLTSLALSEPDTLACPSIGCYTFSNLRLSLNLTAIRHPWSYSSPHFFVKYLIECSAVICV